MTDDRRSQLDSIGFDWGAAALLREKDEGDSMWHERMADLWAKVKEEGRGAFFCLDDPTSELAAWLRQQGHLRRVGKLGPEREKALEALGVCWADVDVGIESSEEQWTAKFERLVAFKEAHGHCDVPSTFQEDLALARYAAHVKQFTPWHVCGSRPCGV